MKKTLKIVTDYDGFLNAVESYYGGYPNQYKRGTVKEYLMEVHDSESLGELYELLINNFSSKYRSTPDVADIEEIWNKAHPQQKPYEYAGNNVPLPPPERPQLTDEERAMNVREIVTDWRRERDERDESQGLSTYYREEPGDDLHTRCLKKVRRQEDEIDE